MKPFSRLLLLVIIFLVGCTLPLPEASRVRYYIIREDVLKEIVPIQKERRLTLRIRGIYANHLIDSRKIIFSEKENSRSVYKRSFWVESPVKQFTRLLIGAVEQARVFQSVVGEGSKTGAELELNVDILEFRHDVSSRPGKSIVRVGCVLIALPERTLLAKREFSASGKAASYDAEGAVKGFELALTEILKEIVTWLKSY